MASPRWKGSWVVFVRGVDGTGDIYGVYGSEASAQRKADAVNKRLPQDVDSDAWAYPMPMASASSPAVDIVRRATQ